MHTQRATYLTSGYLTFCEWFQVRAAVSCARYLDR